MLQCNMLGEKAAVPGPDLADRELADALLGRYGSRARLHVRQLVHSLEQSGDSAGTSAWLNVLHLLTADTDASV
jgi:hypothetical protein